MRKCIQACCFCSCHGGRCARELSDNLRTHSKNVRVGARVADEVGVVTKPMPERSYAATPGELGREHFAGAQSTVHQARKSACCN